MAAVQQRSLSSVEVPTRHGLRLQTNDTTLLSLPSLSISLPDVQRAALETAFVSWSVDAHSPRLFFVITSCGQEERQRGETRKNDDDHIII